MDIHAQQSRELVRHESGRRRTLLGALALWLTPWAWAGAEGVGRAADLAGSGAKRFIEFSKLATGHQQLDPALGATLFAALVAQDRAFTSKLALLTQFARRRQITDVDSLDAALRNNPLRDDLMGIIAAWYTGAVGTGPQAKAVTYGEALMYAPVADGSHNPGFCAGATNSWASLTRPPIDVLPKS
jgi:hypothetical protein